MSYFEFHLFNPLDGSPAVATETIAALASVWRRSVQATHHFLSGADFSEIDQMVSYAYLPHTSVWIATSANTGIIGGFMGVTQQENGYIHIDTLFLDPSCIGIGLGRKFILKAFELATRSTNDVIVSVDVNEQNIRAVQFYRHMGFKTVGRDAKDADGRPYPVLHMSLAG